MKNEIAQLFITGISGKALNTQERDFLRANNLGGVLLFSRNYDRPTQLIDLVNEIQSFRKEYPLFVAVDYEGGRVQRFKDGFSCDVNLNVSPCADILEDKDGDIIGDRSFGKDHDTVSKFITAAIRGMQANKVLACAKHFPGHGSTSVDSHFDLPVIHKSLKDLKENDLIPFSKASKSRVEFVMMAHLMYPEIDELNPSSLSAHFYDLLRNECRFNKIIISDDLQMEALKGHEDGNLAYKSLSAGADMVIYRDFNRFVESFEEVRSSCDFDINEKVKRILSVKTKNLLPFKKASLEEAKKILKNSQHSEIIDSILKG